MAMTSRPGISGSDYEIRLLQAQATEVGHHANMLRGFVEGFLDDRFLDRTASTGLYFNEYQHFCRFEGTERSGTAGGAESGEVFSTDTAGASCTEPADAVFQNPFYGSGVTGIVAEFTTGETDAGALMKIYGSDTLSDWQLLAESTETLAGIFAIEYLGTSDFRYYRFEVIPAAGSSCRLASTVAAPFAVGSFGAARTAAVHLAVSSKAFAPATSVLQTKLVPLAGAVSGGKVYLFHRPLPAGVAMSVAVKLGAEVSEMATEAGQVVQAMRMMKKATPAGKLYSAENAVKKINSNLRQKYKKKFERGKMQEITLSNELRQKLLDAKTTEAADAAMGEIEQYIANQLPSTIADKADALRYFAMLSNPKTHIRNLIGNVAFGKAVDAKDVVGAVIERLALPEEKRTKAILTPKDKALRDVATRDYETVKAEITGTGKLNPVNRIEAQKKIFKHEALNKITGLPGDLLELSDGVALRGRYTKSLTGFLKARGITAENIGTEKGQRALSAGRKYAIEEAKKATFRDTSKVANTLSQLEKRTLRSA